MCRIKLGIHCGIYYTVISPSLILLVVFLFCFALLLVLSGRITQVCVLLAILFLFLFLCRVFQGMEKVGFCVPDCRSQGSYWDHESRCCLSDGVNCK